MIIKLTLDNHVYREVDSPWCTRIDQPPQAYNHSIHIWDNLHASTYQEPENINLSILEIDRSNIIKIIRSQLIRSYLCIRTECWKL